MAGTGWQPGEAAASQDKPAGRPADPARGVPRADQAVRRPAWWRPGGFAVSLCRGYCAGHLAGDRGPRRQPMRGFAET